MSLFQYHGKVTPDGEPDGWKSHYFVAEYWDVIDEWCRIATKNSRLNMNVKRNDDVMRSMLGEWAVDSYGFYGGTSDKMKTYLTDGYSVPEFDAIEPMVPTRQKRIIRFGEDGDLDVGVALSGDEYSFLEITRKESKPGVNLVIGSSFMANTPTRTISEYGTWCGSVIGGLQSAGIDPAVTYRIRGSEMCRGESDNTTIDIVLKKESEPTDFHSFSAMFSPAAYRMLGFASIIWCADERKQEVQSNLGTLYKGQKRGREREWDVHTHEASGTLHLNEDQMGGNFPVVEMTTKLEQTGIL